MSSAAQMISDYLGAAAKAGASRSTLRQRRWALGLLLEQAEAIAFDDRTGTTSADVTDGAVSPDATGDGISSDAQGTGEAPSSPATAGPGASSFAGEPSTSSKAPSPSTTTSPNETPPPSTTTSPNETPPPSTSTHPNEMPPPGTSTSPIRTASLSRTAAPLTVSQFLALGPRAEGRLLAANPDTPIPTMRAWRASIRALATYAGMDADAPSLPRPLARKVLSSEGVRALETLRHRQMVTLMPEEQARLAMVLALLATAPLTGTQLCAVRLADLDDRMTTLRLPPAQPHEWRRLELSPESAAAAEPSPKKAPTPAVPSDPPAPPSEPVLLPAYAKDAIVRWLAVRESLVSALQGKTDVLLVSVAANHDPRTRATLPPGLPLKPRGLQRSFARAALAANAELAGQPGFPLPRSLELARRSYHAWRG